MRTFHTFVVFGWWRHVARTCVYVLLLTATPIWCVEGGQRGAAGQPQRGGQGGATNTTPAEPASGQVRVPYNWANIHAGPSSGNELIVVVPKGTILKLTGRDKEWVQVELTPDLRKTGMVMRWYKNEQRGWMHDSTIEMLKPGAERGAPPR